MRITFNGVISDTTLTNGDEVLSVDYQLSKNDELFNTANIVYESIDNTDNLTSIMFTIECDIDATYYGRVRRKLTSGYTVYGNVEVFTIKDKKHGTSSATIDLPGFIATPEIIIEGDANYQPGTMFDIKITPYSAYNGKWKETLYIIENIHGEVVWQGKGIYKQDIISVTDIILIPSNIYRIKASYTNTAGDTSDFGSTTIKIGDNLNTTHNDFLTIKDNEDLLVELDFIPNLTKIEWSLIASINNELKTINTYETVLRTLTIPKEDLLNNELFVLKYTVTTDTIKEYNITILKI